MKFSFLVSAFIFIVVGSISTSALARDIKKGTVQISGNSAAGFGKLTEKVEGDKESKTTTSIDLSVEYLYYVVDNFSVGILASYADTEYSYDTFSQTYTSKRIGPIIQISIPMNNITNIFIGVTAGYAYEEASAKSSYYNYNDELYDASVFFYGAKAGISLFPVDNFSVDFGASYMHETGKDDRSKLDVERDYLRGEIGLSVYF